MDKLYIEVGDFVVVEWPGSDFEIVPVTEVVTGVNEEGAYIDVYFNVKNVVGCESSEEFVNVDLPICRAVAVQKGLLDYVSLEEIDGALLRVIENDDAPPNKHLEVGDEEILYSWDPVYRRYITTKHWKGAAASTGLYFEKIEME